MLPAPSRHRPAELERFARKPPVPERTRGRRRPAESRRISPESFPVNLPGRGRGAAKLGRFRSCPDAGRAGKPRVGRGSGADGQYYNQREIVVHMLLLSFGMSLEPKLGVDCFAVGVEGRGRAHESIRRCAFSHAIARVAAGLPSCRSG